MSPAAPVPVWSPQEPGVQQICYLLSEYQKPGTNQSQVLACSRKGVRDVHEGFDIAVVLPYLVLQQNFVETLRSSFCASGTLPFVHSIADPCTAR